MEEVCDNMVPRLYDKYEKKNEKKKMLIVNGERSIYQDASSSSDGISEGSELPDIISDLITSTRLRNAVRRD